MLAEDDRASKGEGSGAGDEDESKRTQTRCCGSDSIPNNQ